MDDEIKVSINCLVYNHAKYLRKCLDGFIMQKTNFKFEVLIHDDASTDGSQDIIREYEEKYPDIIKPIYQTENQYSKGVRFSKKFQFPRIKGKYVAFCEGDDYWCDENKLQIQFDIMENNPGCSICTHRVGFVNEEGIRIEGSFPEQHFSEGIIIGKELVKEIPTYFFHTTSFFFRFDKFKESYLDNFDLFSLASVGDVPIMYALFSVGDCYYIDKEMSCYRRFSIGSWSNMQKDNKNRSYNLKKTARFINAYCDYIADKVDLSDSDIEKMRNTALNEEFWSRILVNDYSVVVDERFSKILNNLPLRKRLLFKLLYKCKFVKKIYLMVKEV